jgi:hypothetical protein
MAPRRFIGAVMRFASRYGDPDEESHEYERDKDDRSGHHIGLHSLVIA